MGLIMPAQPGCGETLRLFLKSTDHSAAGCVNGAMWWHHIGHGGGDGDGSNGGTTDLKDDFHCYC